MIGNAACDHEVAENIKDVLTVETPRDPDGEAFTGVFINDGEHAQPFAVPRPVLDEVVGPDVIAMLWPQPDARSVIEP